MDNQPANGNLEPWDHLRSKDPIWKVLFDFSDRLLVARAELAKIQSTQRRLSNQNGQKNNVPVRPKVLSI